MIMTRSPDNQIRIRRKKLVWIVPYAELQKIYRRANPGMNSDFCHPVMRDNVLRNWDKHAGLIKEWVDVAFDCF